MRDFNMLRMALKELLQYFKEFRGVLGQASQQAGKQTSQQAGKQADKQAVT